VIPPFSPHPHSSYPFSPPFPSFPVFVVRSLILFSFFLRISPSPPEGGPRFFPGSRWMKVFADRSPWSPPIVYRVLFPSPPPRLMAPPFFTKLFFYGPCVPLPVCRVDFCQNFFLPGARLFFRWVYPTFPSDPSVPPLLNNTVSSLFLLLFFFFLFIWPPTFKKHV